MRQIHHLKSQTRCPKKGVHLLKFTGSYLSIQDTEVKNSSNSAVYVQGSNVTIKNTDPIVDSYYWTGNGNGTTQPTIQLVDAKMTMQGMAIMDNYGRGIRADGESSVILTNYDLNNPKFNAIYNNGPVYADITKPKSAEIYISMITNSLISIENGGNDVYDTRGDIYLTLEDVNPPLVPLKIGGNYWDDPFNEIHFSPQDPAYYNYYIPPAASTRYTTYDLNVDERVLDLMRMADEYLQEKHYQEAWSLYSVAIDSYAVSGYTNNVLYEMYRIHSEVEVTEVDMMAIVETFRGNATYAHLDYQSGRIMAKLYMDQNNYASAYGEIASLAEVYTDTSRGLLLELDSAIIALKENYNSSLQVNSQGSVQNYELDSRNLEYAIAALDGIDLKKINAEEETPALPNSIEIAAYPNPFNPTTTVELNLPNASRIDIRVYDILGREVMSSGRRMVQAGKHSYAIDGSAWASGIYFVNIQVGQEVFTKKLVLLK